jgi:hypothetical protein
MEGGLSRGAKGCSSYPMSPWRTVAIGVSPSLAMALLRPPPTTAVADRESRHTFSAAARHYRERLFAQFAAP